MGLCLLNQGWLLSAPSYSAPKGTARRSSSSSPRSVGANLASAPSGEYRDSWLGLAFFPEMTRVNVTTSKSATSPWSMVGKLSL